MNVMLNAVRTLTGVVAIVLFCSCGSTHQNIHNIDTIGITAPKGYVEFIMDDSLSWKDIYGKGSYSKTIYEVEAGTYKKIGFVGKNNLLHPWGYVNKLKVAKLSGNHDFSIDRKSAISVEVRDGMTTPVYVKYLGRSSHESRTDYYYEHFSITAGKPVPNN